MRIIAPLLIVSIARLDAENKVNHLFYLTIVTMRRDNCKCIWLVAATHSYDSVRADRAPANACSSVHRVAVGGLARGDGDRAGLVVQQQPSVFEPAEPVGRGQRAAADGLDAEHAALVLAEDDRLLSAPDRLLQRVAEDVGVGRQHRAAADQRRPARVDARYADPAPKAPPWPRCRGPGRLGNRPNWRRAMRFRRSSPRTCGIFSSKAMPPRRDTRSKKQSNPSNFWRSL